MFPQLTTGAYSQFPVGKQRRTRTVTNVAADGSCIKLADPNGALTEWQLRYENLSDTELANLQTFFTLSEGSLNGFTFLDPSGNLLAWSEDLTNAVWGPGPFLALAGAQADPLGGSNAFQLTNSGQGLQSVTQTLNVPAGYEYSLSFYVKAAQATTVTLLLGSSLTASTAGPNWSRISATGNGNQTAASIVFGIELPPGSIDVFGPQVEVQGAPSAYQKSTTGGVYQNARFGDDFLSFTTTDVNRHSVTVNIVYANHL
jgi:hypothetical protein